MTRRIIPCLDVDKGRVVKGKKFQNLQDVADPVTLAKLYNQSSADELVFYDITATNENRNIFIDLLEKVAAEVTIPFTVGGGIRSLTDIQAVLEAGANKISINSAAINNPSFIEAAAKEFGTERIVFAMDVGEVSANNWIVYSNGGRKNTNIDAISWAKQGEALGAGEIVVNSINMDGVKTGYNIALTKAIVEAVTIPVVASGGAGEKEHFRTVFELGNADAALAASVFHYGEINIRELKSWLQKQNIPVGRI